jgi:hypothetical protein
MMKTLLLAGMLSLSVSSFAQFAGNALDFDGSNDMVVSGTVPAMFSSPATNDFTIEVWVNPRGSAFQRVFFAQPSTSNFVSLGPSTGNVIYFYVIRNGTTFSVATTTSITQNAWTHVAARWTAATNTVEVFFNGVQQPTVAGGGSSTGTSGLMVVGARPGGGAQHFNGQIDELRCWNEARTLCEIQSNYMRSITGVQPNLIVNYDFNQGSPAGNNTGVLTLPDNSGNAFNGTLANFTLTGSTSNWVSSAANVTTQGNPLGGMVYTQTAAVCSGGSYTFPDGTTQSNITSTATQSSTLTAANGCDSTINTTVNVLQPTSFTESASVCSGGSYTFPDGSTQTNLTTVTTYNSTLTNAAGCDSVVTTTVSILQPTASSQAAFVCTGGSYTFPDGSTTSNITAQITEMDTLVNAAGCDSVITTTVDVHPAFSSTDSAAICYGGSYTFPDGVTMTGITSATVHTSALSTINGCDSIITTSIGIIAVDTLVNALNETLTANAAGATYQWLDCSNGMSPIAGETNQSFTATVNGSYALAITENGCTDTTSCFTILSTGVAGADAALALSVFPNPANDALTVQTNHAGVKQLEIVSLTGEVVLSYQFSGTVTQVSVVTLAAGAYVVKLTTLDGTTVTRLQKQ